MMRLRRERVSLVMAGIVLAVLAVWLWWELSTPRYRTQSLLQVAREVPRLVPDPQAKTTTEKEYGYYQNTQITYIRSRMVLGAALRKPEMAQIRELFRKQDPASWLAENLQVGFDGEILSIGLQGDDPKQITTIVNAVTDAYLDEVVNVERNRRLTRYTALKEMFDKYQKDLERRRATLRKVVEAAGMWDAGVQSMKRRLLESQLTLIVQQLGRVRLELMERQAERDLLSGDAAAQERARLEQRIAVLERVRKGLGEEMSTLQSSLSSLESQTLDLTATRDEIAQAEAVVGRIGAEAETLRIELDAPARIQLIERAEVATPQ